MECDKLSNLSACNCTYSPCQRKGKCCECIVYHRRAGELPACYFDAAAERTYDRSLYGFMKNIFPAGPRKGTKVR